MENIYAFQEIPQILKAMEPTMCVGCQKNERSYKEENGVNTYSYSCSVEQALACALLFVQKANGLVCPDLEYTREET